MKYFKGLLSLLALACTLPTTAQTTQVELSLSECVAFAQENSPLRLTIQPKVETLELDYSVARQAFLPSLNASLGENFSFGRSQGRDNLYSNTSTANTSFSLSADLPLFQGGERWYRLQKSKEARGNAEYIIAEVEDNIALKFPKAISNSFWQSNWPQQHAKTLL